MNSYNELPMLQVKYRYCQQQGVFPIIIDNMSTDGTVEFCEKNKIAFSQIDTNNCFDLRKLLSEMQNILHIIKPDWFIYLGMDAFPIFENGIIKECMQAENEGYNMIALSQYTFQNTGEEMTFINPFANNFHYQLTFTGSLIAQYHPAATITPDRLHLPDPRVYFSKGAIFESHCWNTPERRAEILERRQRAWLNGMPKNWGTHYLNEQHTNYIFAKEKCKDVRTEKDLFELYLKAITI